MDKKQPVIKAKLIILLIIQKMLQKISGIPIQYTLWVGTPLENY